MKKLCQLIALLFAVAVGSICFAQTDTARLQGTVTDPNGAAIVKAKVAVTNTGTGRVSTAETNDQGYYVVPALPAGQYHMDVAQQGFEKSSRDFELQVSQIAVVDFQMVVGSVNQSIEVSTASPVIDAGDSAIGTVIEGRRICANGRNFV